MRRRANMKKLILLFTSFMSLTMLAGCKGEDDPVPPADQYTFSFTGEHCKVQGANKYTYSERINKGETNLTFPLVADNDYCLPSSVSDLPEGVNYINGTISIAKMLTNYTVKVTATPATDKVQLIFHGEHCKAFYDDDYEYTQEYNKGAKNARLYIRGDNDKKYKMPTKDEVTLPIGARYELHEDEDGKYGIVFIDEMDKTYEISITATEILYKHTFKFVGTACKIDGEEYYECTKEIIEDRSYTFKIVPDDTFHLLDAYPGLPESVTYSKANSSITISNFNTDITVKMSAAGEGTFKIIYDAGEGNTIEGTNDRIKYSVDYASAILWEDVGLDRGIGAKQTDKEFLYWSLAVNGNPVPDDHQFTGETTLYAVYDDIPEHANEYFTITARTNDVVIGLDSKYALSEPVQYSTESAPDSWIALNLESRITIPVGESYYFKTANEDINIGTMGSPNTAIIKNYGRSGTREDEIKGYVSVRGPVVSLTNNKGNTGVYSKLLSGGNTFTYLDPVSAENLILPTTFIDKAFASMFYSDKNLVVAPSLPSMNLTEGCYNSMFASCEALTKAPTLPAIDLSNASSCYDSMFKSSGLISVPSLPAATLSKYCYRYMFNSCNKLTSVPENLLQAQSIAEGCYYAMFQGCRALTNAPDLPATTLYKDCYYQMFYSCIALTTTPTLPAESLMESCYYYMFNGCTGLTNVALISAKTLNNKSCSFMFNGCTALAIKEAETADTPFFVCPDTTGLTDPVKRMFKGVVGAPDDEGTPEFNHSYCIA